MGPTQTKIIKQLIPFRKLIQKKYGVTKVILFGSLATGHFTKESDVDLIVISDAFKGKKSFERSPPLYKDWKLGYPVDFLCFTPEEFERKRKIEGILHEAMKKAVEI